MSSPASPLRVSVPEPLMRLYDALPPADDISIDPPAALAVRFTVPEFVVSLSATKEVILMALAVAPELTTKSSPVAKSFTVSVPASMLKVSLPPPPVKLSLSAPPVMISLPVPPAIISFPAAPVIVSPPEPPVKLSTPAPPVKV